MFSSNSKQHISVLSYYFSLFVKYLPTASKYDLSLLQIIKLIFQLVLMATQSRSLKLLNFPELCNIAQLWHITLTSSKYLSVCVFSILESQRQF